MTTSFDQILGDIREVYRIQRGRIPEHPFDASAAILAFTCLLAVFALACGVGMAIYGTVRVVMRPVLFLAFNLIAAPLFLFAIFTGWKPPGGEPDSEAPAERNPGKMLP